MWASQYEVAEQQQKHLVQTKKKVALHKWSVLTFIMSETETSTLEGLEFSLEDCMKVTTQL